ncbi:alpha/beta hydrolase [Actinoallomurus iriomotensis]|uniref:Alpha/beta hydrolase n=1 Tax=Actinoallomurus iriomotensis TaxID=478107 RepID=A0A9W6W155_9ACTN|nr:alpha/beta hydrolase fold domain-containing protein [Actinoallomurus iriomotensis]GLY86437.1 alpha/beta hydrolase [Actinoallomurus iriomotensis]
MPRTRDGSGRPPLSALIQKIVMRLVFRLPAPVKRRLAGPAVQIDGRTLDLDAQLLTEMSRRTGFSLVVNESPEESRAAMENGRHALAGPRYKDIRSEDIAIDTAHGGLEATLYTPRHLTTPAPLLVFFHGGGFVIGSRTSYDSTVSFLAHHAQVKIMSVDYRLAPDHPFPAAVEDTMAAFEHAHRHADDLGVDRSRIAVGGDSAGGHLAAVLAQVAARGEGPRPSHQFLFYPATDFTRRHPSRDLFADGLLLTDREITWFADQYAASADRSDPRLSPLLGEVDASIPPAYITTAGFDPLRDEGEQYAEKLRQAGATVTLHREADLVHGYLSFFAVATRFREAALESARAIHDRMHHSR